MKDAYSFDRDEEGARESFERNRGAYKRIFERCDLQAFDVQAESGIMGGKLSVGFLAPQSRARTSSSRASTATTPPTSRSPVAFPARPSSPIALGAPEEVETPGVATIEGLAELLGIDAAATSKAMPVVTARRHARARAHPR